MFKNLEVFKMSQAMAVHAGQKQAVTAQNVANADTPKFKARDVIPFAETYQKDMKAVGWLSQTSTRARHINGTTPGELPEPVIDHEGVGAPNGNTVSLETEMLKSLEASRQHDRALAIYRSALTILRTSLSRA